MNDAEGIIQDLVADLAAVEQQATREILRSCQFQDGNDPTLVLLRCMQLREKSTAETARTKTGRMAKLVYELKCLLYQTACIKLAFVAILLVTTFILSFVLSLSVMVYEVRMHPQALSDSLGLTDWRLLEMRKSGVNMMVYDNPQKPSLIGISLSGKFEGVEKAKDGEIVIEFRKRP